MTDRSEIFEVWSSGPDEMLQGIGGDPYDGVTSTGLRIPTLTTPDQDSRYLFMLCGFSMGENERARIIGWRQLATIGTVQTGASARLIELEINDSIWRGPQSNISWHLRYLSPSILDSYALSSIGHGPVQPILLGTAFRMSQSPALLYETLTPGASGFYKDLSAYVPPGKPPGEPVAHLGTLHDMRAHWRSDRAWDSLDIPVKGAGFYGLFASVRQSPVTAFSVPSPYNENGVPAPENFALNFPGGEGSSTALLWRVAGALVVRVER